jgi:hypothetical protein
MKEAAGEAVAAAVAASEEDPLELAGTAAGAAEEEDPQSQPVECELDEPIWAVVSFEQVEVGGLTYHQAVEMLKEFDSAGINGLCIVSHDAAARLGPQNSRTTFPKLSLDAR